MTIDAKAIRVTLWDLAVRSTGKVWRRSDQEGKPGELPFGTIGNLRFTDLSTGSTTCVLNEDDPLDIDLTLDQSFTMLASFQAYGEDAFAMVAEVIAGAKLEGSIYSEDREGKDVCLGFLDSSPIVDLTGVVGSRQELRAQSDLKFFYRSKYTRTVPSIQSVEITGNGSTQLIEV